MGSADPHLKAFRQFINGFGSLNLEWESKFKQWLQGNAPGISCDMVNRNCNVVKVLFCKTPGEEINGVGFFSFFLKVDIAHLI